MRKITSAVAVIAVASLLAGASACLYPDQNLQAFDPKTEVGYTVGRLWVQPNPLHLTRRDPPDGRHCRYVQVTNIGTEPLVVTGVSLEGNPALSHGLRQLPGTLNPQAETQGFEVCFDESTGEPGEGALVFETDDPLAPVVRLPILVEDGSAEEPVPGNRPNLWVTPNPVRLGNVVAGDPVEVRLACNGCNETSWLRFDELSTTGSLLETVGLRTTVGDGGALSLPVKVIESNNPGEANFTLDLKFVASDPQVLRDTLTLRVSNSLGERYEIGVPVLRE